jgi:hypothetical protein
VEDIRMINKWNCLLAITIVLSIVGAEKPMPYTGPTEIPKEIWVYNVISYSDYLNSDFSKQGPGLWFIDASGNWVPQLSCHAGATVKFIMYLPHSGHVIDSVISDKQAVTDRGYMNAGYYINTLKTPLGKEGTTICFVWLDGCLSNVILLVAKINEAYPSDTSPVTAKPGYDSPGYHGIPGWGSYTVSPDGKSVSFSGQQGLGFGYPGASG